MAHARPADRKKAGARGKYGWPCACRGMGVCRKNKKTGVMMQDNEDGLCDGCDEAFEAGWPTKDKNVTVDDWREGNELVLKGIIKDTGNPLRRLSAHAMQCSIHPKFQY